MDLTVMEAAGEWRAVKHQGQEDLPLFDHYRCHCRKGELLQLRCTHGG